MPIRVLNNAHFNQGPPVTYADYATGQASALDVDAIVKTSAAPSTGATATGAAVDPSVTTNSLPAGMTSLVLDEQFNTLSSARWGNALDGSTYGTGNNSIGTWLSSNSVVAAGSSGATGNTLQMTSRKTSPGVYTCGMVSTKTVGVYYPIFGRYEVRFKLPNHCQGVWPAIWLRHRDGSSTCEMDLMESFHSQRPGKLDMTLHRANNAGTLQKNLSFARVLVEPPTLTPGWHTCAVTMLPSGANVQFTGEFDGVQVWSYLDTQAVYWSDTHGTAHPSGNGGANIWDICLQGSQIGGSYVGHPEDPKGYSRWLDSCLSGGTKPNACNTSVGGQPIWTDAANYGGAAFPNTFEIDYVKVWSAL